MTVQVSHHQRGKQLITIRTDLKPHYSREAPNWMFDQGCCAGMTQGPPVVSIEGLNELAKLLASLGKTRKRCASSSSSNAKERRRAEGRYDDRAQPRLELVNPIAQRPVARGTKGLVEALADIFLEALGHPSPEIPLVRGGADEQDHA